MKDITQGQSSIPDEKFKLFYQDITDYINEARGRAIRTIDRESVMAYWKIGKRIIEEEQQGATRADYGKALLTKLSEKLTAEFGKGFSQTNLKYFRQFYLSYKDAIGHEPRDQFEPKLSWTHYRILMQMKDTEKRHFYEIEATYNNWSTPELQRQIGSLLYDRIAAAKNKQEILALAKQGQIIQKPADAIKDPFILEFLGLSEGMLPHETKLEDLLISHLQKFLLELGKGFAFIGRQERLTLNGDHFYCDLVFYHAILKCYVLIDLKTKPLTHGDLGQMLLYVNYYDKEKRHEGDNPTIGLVLCTEKNDAVVKYLLGERTDQIFASRYQLYLPTESQLKLELEKERSLLEVYQSIQNNDD